MDPRAEYKLHTIDRSRKFHLGQPFRSAVLLLQEAATAVAEAAAGRAAGVGAPAAAPARGAGPTAGAAAGATAAAGELAAVVFVMW